MIGNPRTVGRGPRGSYASSYTRRYLRNNKQATTEADTSIEDKPVEASKPERAKNEIAKRETRPAVKPKARKASEPKVLESFTLKTIPKSMEDREAPDIKGKYAVTQTPDGSNVAVFSGGQAYLMQNGRITGSRVGFSGIDGDLAEWWAGNDPRKWALVYSNPSAAWGAGQALLRERGNTFAPAVSTKSSKQDSWKFADETAERDAAAIAEDLGISKADARAMLKGGYEDAAAKQQRQQALSKKTEPTELAADSTEKYDTAPQYEAPPGPSPIGKSDLRKYQAPPDEAKPWVNIRTGERLTQKEYNALGTSIKADEYVRSKKAIDKYIETESAKLASKTGISPDAAKTVVAANVITKFTPGALDDILPLITLGVIAAGAYAASNKEIRKLPGAAAQAIRDWRTKTGKAVTTDDVIVSTKSGPLTLTQAMERSKSPIATQLVPPDQVKTKTGLRELKQPSAITLDRSLKPPEIVRIQEAIKATPGVTGVYLPTPMKPKSEIIKRQGGIIKAESALLQAESKLTSLPGVKTLPVNWNKVLERAREANRAEDISRAFSDINKQIAQANAAGRLDTTEMEAYYRAYDNYLVRARLLQDAKTQYIASLNPVPVKGKAPSAAAAAAILAAVVPDIRKLQQTAVSKAIKYVNTEGTSTRSINELQEGLQDRLQSQLSMLNKNLTKSQQLTKTQIQTLSQTMTQTAVRTAVNEATQTATDTATQTAELTDTVTKTATGKLTTPLKKPKPDASDDEKRAFIRSYQGGKTTYNMGQLKIGGKLKDVWHVYLDDGSRYVVFGKAPQGATITADGPGSTYKTTQRVGKRGKFPPITRKHGAVTATVRPASAKKQGARINFKSVKRHRQYYTELPGGTAITKKPFNKRR